MNSYHDRQPAAAAANTSALVAAITRRDERIAAIDTTAGTWESRQAEAASIRSDYAAEVESAFLAYEAA